MNMKQPNETQHCQHHTKIYNLDPKNLSKSDTCPSLGPRRKWYGIHFLHHRGRSVAVAWRNSWKNLKLSDKQPTVAQWKHGGSGSFNWDTQTGVAQLAAICYPNCFTSNTASEVAEFRLVEGKSKLLGSQARWRNRVEEKDTDQPDCDSNSV